LAEGVEDEDTAAMLLSLGCDIAQGYYYSKAIPSSNFLSWIQERHSRFIEAPIEATLPAE
jgi:diguanylate cyclase